MHRDRFCYAAGQMQLSCDTVFAAADRKEIIVTVAPAVVGAQQMMFITLTCQVLCYRQMLTGSGHGLIRDNTGNAFQIINTGNAYNL